MSTVLLCVILVLTCLSCPCFGAGGGGAFSEPDLSNVHEDDRLGKFYQRISQPDVKYCQDRTKLLPDCTKCIPGLQQTSGVPESPCDQYIAPSKSIRDEIKKLVIERFGQMPANRTYGLYPYLETKNFLYRHYTIGKMLSSHPITTLIDIGAYYNPINFFITPSVCPANVIIIEPILDPLSAIVPCSGSSEGKSTHIMFLPITFKYYMTIKDMLPMPETVVCIGCDSHYGPARRMLETTFKRPYTLFIEYPSEYVHNAPYRKMNGDGPGEKMTYIERYQPNTNATIYTKRVMKVIEYKEA